MLGPLDLLLSKLCRADEQDIEDVRFLIGAAHLRTEDVRAAIQNALVPEDFRAVFPVNVARLEALLAS